jgi:hypothetical protein
MKLFNVIKYLSALLVIIISGTFDKPLCQPSVFNEQKAQNISQTRIDQVYNHLKTVPSIIKKIRISRIDNTIFKNKNIMLNLFPGANLKVDAVRTEELDGNCTRWIGRSEGALFDNVIVDIYPNSIKGDAYTDIAHYCFWTIDGTTDACAISVVEPPPVSEIKDYIIPDKKHIK